MRAVARAEIYKLVRCRLLYFVPVLFVTAGLLSATYDFEVFGLYEGLEQFVLPTLKNYYLTLGVTLAAGYVLGMDFSKRTLQNALAAGVSRRDYFFSRMGVQMLVTAALYGLAQLTYALGHRLIFPAGGGRPQMELYGIKLAVCMLVSILQLWACISMANALCYFLKKQLPVMLAGMLAIYFELIIRQLADMYGVAAMRGIFDFTPVRVLKNTFENYAMYDGILTFGYLKYGLSALVIIAVSSAAGYMKFWHDFGSG